MITSCNLINLPGVCSNIYDLLFSFMDKPTVDNLNVIKVLWSFCIKFNYNKMKKNVSYKQETIIKICKVRKQNNVALKLNTLVYQDKAYIKCVLQLITKRMFYLSTHSTYWVI